MGFAIATAVYPGVEDYFEEFLKSLINQTDSNFILVVANNGMKQLEACLEQYKVDCYVSLVDGTPVMVRKEMIRLALTIGADQVMFLDADDKAAPNRVYSVKRSLKSSNIVFNDLVLFGEILEGENTSILSAQFENGFSHGIDALRYSNHLGLSNTAVSSTILKDQYLRPPDHIVAYDWLLFSLLLLEGELATYCGSTYTEYRQHGENIANLIARSNSDILRGVGVKSNHYSFLAMHYPEFSDLAEIFSNLSKRIDENDSFAYSYFDWVRSQNFKHTPLWWEIIKVPEDF